MAKSSNTKKKKASAPAKSKKITDSTGMPPRFVAFIMIAVAVILAILIYFPDVCGIFGPVAKSMFAGLFGFPAVFFPLVLAGLGVYLWVKKDVKKLIIKSVLSFLMYITLCGALLCFNIEAIKDFDFNGGYSFAEGGSGWLGILASPVIKCFGNIISAIIFISLFLVLCSIIFKISFIKLIRGFFETAKEEIDEIDPEAAYDAGKKARNKVDDTLHTLTNHSIDFDVDDMNDKKKRKKAKKSKAEEEDALPFKHDESEINDIDVPFNLTGDKADTEDIESIEEVLSRVDFETGEIIEEPYGEAIESEASLEEAPEREEPLTEEQAKALREEMDKSAAREPIPYKFPDVSLLSHVSKKNSDTREELRDTASKLVSTLKSFGVDVKLSQVSRGPTVTRYELQPSIGVKVSKITGLSDDIALNLAATAVRIEAPIPGKAAIGIEIPNKEVSAVSLREVIDTDEFKLSKSKLSVAMGMDITGKPIIADISKMPHVLIAGATGSGKSVCINSIIISILYKADPNEVKLIMVDPKKVELDVYNGIPHLLIPVVTEPKKASGALGWAVSEMMRRYDLFAESGVRNLEGYNEYLALNGEQKLPQIVIIVDELSDLMMVAPKEIEDSICRLAQMARAAGMHLIIATQRPSVNVITGVIKANIPSRIAFAVSSQIDSRTILDGAGAEKLLGKGDMLFLPMGAQKSTRLQGAFISDKEVENVVEFVKGHSEVRYDEDVTEKINSETEIETDMSDCDELLPKAIEIALASGSISTSMVQRRLGVGYARAGRIIDQMEERGIISAADGSKPRNVLVSAEDLR